jgi:membrane-bound ClpP family serine protease
MKVRLIAMGCILIVIGVILIIVKGYSEPLIALPVIGIVLTAIGVVWKPRKKADSIQRDTE